MGRNLLAAGIAAIAFLIGRRARGTGSKAATSNLPTEASPQDQVPFRGPLSSEDHPASKFASPWAAIAAVVLMAGATGTAYIGAQFLPPSYNIPSGNTSGSVEVYVSDPAVRVELDVAIFDVNFALFDETGVTRTIGKPVPSPKIILWLYGNRDEIVDWAVVFTGTARFRDPLLDDGSQVVDGHPVGATTHVSGTTQIVQGRAEVGPNAFTNRPMDWFDEAVGPFFYTSGSWPSYGSKSTAVLPAFGGSRHQADAGLDPALGLVPPNHLSVTINLHVSPPGQFLRIDASEPRVESSSPGVPMGTEMTWSGDSFPEGIQVLYTDVAAEANESSRAVLAGVLLGFAGSVLVAAVGLWVQFLTGSWASRAKRKASSPPV